MSDVPHLVVIYSDYMFCAQCGTSMPKAGNFCPSCGTAIVGSGDGTSHNTTAQGHVGAQAPMPPPYTEHQKEPSPVAKVVRISLIVGGVVFFLLIFASNDSTHTPLPPPQQEKASSNAVPVTPTPTFVPNATAPVEVTPAVSLANGTILKSRSAYLSGDGELEITNGTSEDAVAKLIINGTSVFTVYIKANNSYTMKNITDGIYWLAFAHGTDWDKEGAIFRRGASYSSFEDTFDFETTDTQYTTFEVTLNAVYGGNAATDDVDPTQFNAY